MIFTPHVTNFPTVTFNLVLLCPQLLGATQDMVKYRLSANSVQRSRTKSMSCSNPPEKVAILFYKWSPLCSRLGVQFHRSLNCREEVAICFCKCSSLCSRLGVQFHRYANLYEKVAIFVAKSSPLYSRLGGQFHRS